MNRSSTNRRDRVLSRHGSFEGKRRFRLPSRGNQRGVALILALVMLTILSILGALALSTTDTEIGISSNYQTSKYAFFAAQRAVEYAETAGPIYENIGTTSGSSIDLNGTYTVGSNTTSYSSDISQGTGSWASGLDTSQTNTVTYLTSGAPPPGSGTDPTYFQSLYYQISVTAQGPHNSVAHIDAQVARVVPK